VKVVAIPDLLLSVETPSPRPTRGSQSHAEQGTAESRARELIARYGWSPPEGMTKKQKLYWNLGEAAGSMMVLVFVLFFDLGPRISIGA
jgi:hypothetical protein